MGGNNYMRTVFTAYVFVVWLIAPNYWAHAAAAEKSPVATAGTIESAVRRTALIIGNGEYKSAPLANPVNDAADLAKALAEVGFDVTVRLNLNQIEMRRAIREFGDRLRTRGGVGLFYYAGHGAQVKGRNFLIPVGMEIQREYEIADQSVDANLILDTFEDAGNRLNIMILDACRNNPFLGASRAMGAGLARMDAPSGALIAFATKPGSVAADGDGRNGLYTKHLIGSVKQTGLTIEQVFKRVREGVEQESQGLQSPREESSLKGEDFYFVAPVAGDVGRLADMPMDTLKTLASGGNVKAQAALGARYFSGTQGAKLDQTEGVSWMTKAAETGDPDAQFNLAWAYYLGAGVSRDYSRALEWGLKAAKQGHKKAQYYAGNIYISGELGVNPDYKEGAKWYQLAADQGDAEAQTALGRLYQQGQGVTQDSKKAAELFQRAVDGGNFHAAADLAALNMMGVGVAKDYEKARTLAQSSIDRVQSPSGKLILGLLYLDGWGVDKDPQKALGLLQEAKAAGIWQADNAIARAKSAVEPGKTQNAVPDEIKALQERANAGDVRAQYDLAQKFENGEDGMRPDIAKAFELRLSAAKSGYALAQSSVGMMYALGKGVDRNREEAAKWFKMAYAADPASVRYLMADNLLTLKRSQDEQLEAINILSQGANAGDAYCQTRLAQVYAFGEAGVTKDEPKAIELYRKAAAQNNEWAQLGLGQLIFYRRDPTPQNRDEARNLFEQAARQGNRDAMDALGLIYELGEGVKTDPSKALQYYRPAAERGNAHAQHRLGVLLARGEAGVPKDAIQAVKWLRLSADQGFPPAIGDLAWVYENGFGGLERNREEATRLYTLAASKGVQNAKNALERLANQQ